ncbi:MAG TPA: 3-oxoacyl-ACP reductase family protein [Blastocatellia bacterium]|nr:3-oxoacyl-ACP reductase family protein [Blastocatellia bacterium]
MKLTNKVALVTGGGTGIGLAISTAFARAGATVVINYSQSNAEAIKAVTAIRELGVPSTAIQADVSKDQEVRAMIDKIRQLYGRMDILVNNAGFTRFVDHADLEALNEEDWDRIFDVNVKGAFFCCRAAAPLMKEHGFGRIINIASIAGLTGLGSSIPYAASKAAMITLTKSLARVLAPEISVNAIAPGLIETRWINASQHVDAMREKFKETTLLKRVGTPEDVAELALSVAADWNYVTGQVLVVDGGWAI